MSEVAEVEAKVCSRVDCRLAGLTQPSANYYKDKRARDGLQSNCKECQNKQTYPYLKSEKGKAIVRRYAQSEKGKETLRKAKKKAIAKNPQRHRARLAVGHEVRTGRMPPASSCKCTRCGEEAVEYHHHLGYEEEHKLDVVPVCITCHTSEN